MAHWGGVCLSESQRPSQVYNGNPYTNKKVSSWWVAAQGSLHVSNIVVTGGSAGKVRCERRLTTGRASSDGNLLLQPTTGQPWKQCAGYTICWSKSTTWFWQWCFIIEVFCLHLLLSEIDIHLPVLIKISPQSQSVKQLWNEFGDWQLGLGQTTCLTQRFRQTSLLAIVFCSFHQHPVLSVDFACRWI